MDYENCVAVGIGELKTAKTPNKLRTYALGSCVGVAIYDIKHNVGGLIHILLSNSDLFPNATNKLKFADIAIPKLYEELIYIGAEKKYLRAKIAGGANMFHKAPNTSFYNIGGNNISTVKKQLDKAKIPIIAEDVGGYISRTMTLDLTNFEVEIKSYEGNLSKLEVL